MSNHNNQSVTLYSLDQYGLLKVDSTDNLKFLQGQLTCDLNEISVHQWRYGALCTNKGRVIGNFLIQQSDDNQHYLRLARKPLEAVHNTLQKFAPFYKGQLDDCSPDFHIVGVHGPQSAALIESTFSSAPDENESAIIHKENEVRAVIVHLDQTRFECWLPRESYEMYWQQLSGSPLTKETIGNAADWDLLNIRAGLGEVREQTIEQWTPHMLNLQAVGAISFTKGCYTGQEIVARTEYRGQQKRAMYHIQGKGSAPEPGTDIYQQGKDAGEIVLAATTSSDTEDQEWEGLAVIGSNYLEGALSCEDRAVALLDLPYQL